MSPKGRRFARNLLVALAVMGAGAWLAPRFVGVEHFRPKLRAALGRALGRPVTFGKISLHFLPRPGFTLQDVVVGELPEFGSEPFGNAASLSCDLRWRSLWQSRLSFSDLTLEDASLNLVRNAQGRWNIEALMTGTTAGPDTMGAGRPNKTSAAPLAFAILVHSARLNFKIGQDKKPFALTDVNGRVDIDPGSRMIRFQLAGRPIRTDLDYPSPGTVELAGEWRRDALPGGELDATLRVRQTLLYDWIPLISGANPALSGLLDSEIRLTGPLEDPQFDGQARLTRLHRWEQLPLAGPLPCTLHFRGDFNRQNGQLRIAGLDLAFGSSQIRLAGVLSGIPAAKQLDLVFWIEHSRLADLADLYRHLSGRQVKQDLAGNVDGMLTVQGPWESPRYGGVVSARGVSLRTAAGDFPISEMALRIAGYAARLDPVRIQLAPHVEAVAEGSVEGLPQIGSKPLKIGPPKYELTLRANSVPLHDLLRLARGIGMEDAQHLDAQGFATLSVRLTGAAWPWSRPEVSALGSVRSVQMMLPGLTEPLNIPRAAIKFDGATVLVSPVVAVMGTSVFSGWLERQGSRKDPWTFALKADHLDIRQGAAWFEVLGEQVPAPLLAQLPGISSFLERRKAESGIFDRLNAQGRFSTPSLTYEDLTLHQVSANLRVQGRTIEIGDSTFRAGSGRGTGKVTIDLTGQPARWSAGFSLTGARMGALGRALPGELRQVRGSYSALGSFTTQGLSRSQLLRNLRGSAAVTLRDVDLGRFDLLGTLAREAGARVMVSAQPASSFIQSGRATFIVGESRLQMQDGSLDFGNTRLALTGNYFFDGLINLTVQGNLNAVEREWTVGRQVETPGARLARLEFTGTLGHLVKTIPPRVPQPAR